MKDVIDIYTKILIAILGFVAPSMTLLLGVFAEGVIRQRQRNEEKIKQLEDLILQEPQQIKGKSQDKIDYIKGSIKQHEEQKEKAQKDINLLSPKRQVIRVFGTLTLSIILAALYYFFRSPYFKTDLKYFKLVTLILSLGAFFYSLFSLWQIFCTITELKQIDAIDKINTIDEIKIEQQN